GFTGGQADTLRKAVGKKKIDLMNKVKPEFIEGAVKIGGRLLRLRRRFGLSFLNSQTIVLISRMRRVMR
ncbi:hypothetical protein IJG71_00460, partial [Candidatus Saccharibacteria bacterium]|nr:hypothetical protein [Candidatus Saccharibacteria bacterium]